jgi:hypothetical protein
LTPSPTTPRRACLLSGAPDARRARELAARAASTRSAVQALSGVQVLALRLPTARPIAGRVASVSSRARSMATWRAKATALQHFYRATARPMLDEDPWRTLPSGLRRELSGETVEGLDDLRAASEAGTLDDPAVIVTRTPLELDERAFKKLNRLLSRTLEQALQIAAEGAGRHGEKSTDVFATELAILHFKRAQPGPR